MQSLKPKFKCQAKIPSQCKYHGSFIRLNIAVQNKDYASYVKEKTIIEELEKNTKATKALEGYDGETEPKLYFSTMRNSKIAGMQAEKVMETVAKTEDAELIGQALQTYYPQLVNTPFDDVASARDKYLSEMFNLPPEAQLYYHAFTNKNVDSKQVAEVLNDLGNRNLKAYSMLNVALNSARNENVQMLKEQIRANKPVFNTTGGSVPTQIQKDALAKKQKLWKKGLISNEDMYTSWGKYYSYKETYESLTNTTDIRKEAARAYMQYLADKEALETFRNGKHWNQILDAEGYPQGSRN